MRRSIPRFFAAIVAIILSSALTVAASFSQEVRLKVIASGDDGFYTRLLGEMNRSAIQNIFGISGAFERRQFDRWQDVPIPQGATIDSAWLVGRTLTSSQTTDPSVLVRGHAVDSAVPIPDSASWSSAWANGTAAYDSVYQWADWPSAFTWYRLPFDVSGVIQELVNRPGWKPGNAVALLFEGRQNSERATSSFDNGGGGDSLIVWYTVIDSEPSTRRRSMIIRSQ